MATRPQIAMIHTLKSRLSLSDGNYREILGSFGVTSSKEMSMKQAKALIETLVSMASGSNIPVKKSASNNEFASFAQQAKIRKMWENVSRMDDEISRKKALNSFLKNRFHIERLEWLPRSYVGRIVKTLEVMKGQK